MMNVAIVGASKLTKYDKAEIEKAISVLLYELIGDYGIGNITIVSGGADGVDSIAEKLAKEYKLNTKIFKPDVQQWEDEGDKIGFKTRNLKIASECDILYCFPNKLIKEKCYHCDERHEVGGGCWTMKQAKNMRKQIHLRNPYHRLG